MSTIETMRSADLSLYPIAGLVVFLGVFLLVALRTLRPRRPLDSRAIANLALDDGEPVTPANAGGPR